MSSSTWRRPASTSNALARLKPYLPFRKDVGHASIRGQDRAGLKRLRENPFPNAESSGGPFKPSFGLSGLSIKLKICLHSKSMTAKPQKRCRILNDGHGFTGCGKTDSSAGDGL
jgi:hypothetical protein